MSSDPAAAAGVRIIDLREIIQDDPNFVVLRRSARVCDFFNSNSIFFYHDDLVPDENQFVTIRKSAVIEPYSLRSGYIAGTVGAFTYLYTDREMHEVAFGRYCSVASDITIFGERHPLEWVTTSNITYSFEKPLFNRAHRELMGSKWVPLAPPPTGTAAIVGHDVWIGQGAFLARNIALGTGSIVGAGSVVTRSVEPYTIVAGNPARVIRKRFSDGLIERLLASHWWDAHPDCLFRYDASDPAIFLDQLDAGRASGEIGASPIQSFTCAQILASIAALP